MYTYDTIYLLYYINDTILYTYIIAIYIRLLYRVYPHQRDIMNKVDKSPYLDKRFNKRTNRITNSLNQHYEIYGIEHHDDPLGSKPKALKPYIPDNHLLQTRDIPGAEPGSVWVVKEVRQPRDLTTTQDIQGAQADTLKRVLVTSRITNPVQPEYQSLDGGGATLAPLNRSLIPVTLYKNNKYINNNDNNDASLPYTPTSNQYDDLTNTIDSQDLGMTDTVADSARLIYSAPLPSISNSTPRTNTTGHLPSTSKPVGQKKKSSNDSSVFDHYYYTNEAANIAFQTMRISDLVSYDKPFSPGGDGGGDTGAAFKEFMQRKYPTTSTDNTIEKTMRITSTLRSVEAALASSTTSLGKKGENKKASAAAVVKLTGNDLRAYRDLKSEVDAVRGLK